MITHLEEGDTERGGRERENEIRAGMGFQKSA